MRLSGLLSTLEQSIAKYGYKDYLHHQNELLPSLIQQIASIPKETFGSYDIPSRADEKYANTKIKPIIWTDVYRDPEFAYGITIFRLFKGGTMPLHDHPDISGINYLLTGNVIHNSYDIVDVLNMDKRQFIGIKYPQSEYKQNEAIMTLPNKENLHQFTAKENTAILQILLPDFDHKQRICSYWKVVNNLSDDTKRNSLVKLQRNNNDIEIKMDDIVGLNIIAEPKDKLDINSPFDGILE